MNRLGLVLRGLAMGIAEVIPGVSGGTIAFITGIYERLIKAVKSFSPSLVSTFKKGGLSGVWQKIDGQFLLYLLLGMALGFIGGVFVITHLLDVYPEPLWGFFFGLILASCFIIGREIKSWTIRNMIWLLAGAGFAYWITVVTPSEGSANLLYIFFAAILAISALILPGISGSFVLLLLGAYTIVIPSIKNVLTDFNLESFSIVIVFGLGALVGLALFSRILTWLFKHYRDQVFAILTGFMLGSLNKIWPWRNPTIVYDKSTDALVNASGLSRSEVSANEAYKIISEINVTPEAYAGLDAHLGLVVISAICGVLIVFIFDYINKKVE